MNARSKMTEAIEALNSVKPEHRDVVADLVLDLVAAAARNGADPTPEESARPNGLSHRPL